MPWKATCALDERMRFIVESERVEVGMAELCRQARVSRKTGCAGVNRYQAERLAGLAERSRAPHQRPGQIETEVAEGRLAERAAHPTRDPRKLVARLQQVDPDLALPAASTVGALLSRAGLTVRRWRRARATPSGGGLLGGGLRPTDPRHPRRTLAPDSPGQAASLGAHHCHH